MTPLAFVLGCGQGKHCQHWPVCKFDYLPVLFLVTLSVLTTNAACHLPLYQCISIAFRILVLFVRFIVSSVVQCYLVRCLNKHLVNRTAYNESRAWCYVPHCRVRPPVCRLA